MSTFKTQQSGSFRFNLRYSRVECTMVSHPPGTLTPNWRGERYLAAERATLRIAILWTILRIIPPIAIGLKRSEEHTSELQSLIRISYAVFCLQTNINSNADNLLRSV